MKRGFGMKNWFYNILNKYGIYKINDLQGWGHCAVCGAYIPNKVFPREWAWGYCSKCMK